MNEAEKALLQRFNGDDLTLLNTLLDKFLINK